MSECKICGAEITEEQEYSKGVCDDCYFEAINDIDEAMREYVKDDEGFYVRYRFGVEGDYYKELFNLCKTALDVDLFGLKRETERQILVDYCRKDESHYIDFYKEYLRGRK